MGLKDCIITLDNPWNTYYPGQTINGRVDYTFDKPKKVRGISIKFKGGAETSWHETKSVKNHTDNTSRNVSVKHSAEEEYFGISYYLLGNKSGKEIEIEAGTHSYPFTCTLPPTLPSSFEGEHGFVRYTVKVTLDRPWKFDQDTKMAFTVVSHMDLNTMPQCQQPLVLHMEKNFCCCWCKSGPLTVDIGLPVSGFCSGQVMPFDIGVENGSNVQVKAISIKFFKDIVFHSHTPVNSIKESKITISEILIDSIDAHTSKNIQKSLEIPPLPPSSLANCHIIDVDYKIRVKVEVGKCHFDMSESQPITIGTVPLINFQSPPPTGDTIKTLPDIPPPTNPTPDAPLLDDSNYPAQPVANASLYPQLNQGAYPPGSRPSAPPMQPVFQESHFSAKSIHDGGDNEHTMISGNAAFAPRYPTYGFVIPQ